MVARAPSLVDLTPETDLGLRKGVVVVVHLRRQTYFPFTLRKNS